MVCGLTDATEGQVFLDGKDVTKLPLSSRAQLGIGYLPQESSIFKDLTVEDNLTIAAEALSIPNKIMKPRMEKLLEIFNIEPIRNRLGVRLSGGERRRVEITRALVTSPYFMILDEPFAGVDPIAVAEIKEIITRLKEQGMGILISDHNVRETLKVCDRAYILNEGKILETGAPEKIVNSSLAKQFYLGQDFAL